MAVRTGMAKGLFYKRGWNGLDADDSGSGGRAIYTDQGLVSMTGVFWDTLVMCAVTALAILSDMVKMPLLTGRPL